MSEHHCIATSLDPVEDPLNVSRVLRLLLASLDDTTDTRDAGTPVLVDLGGCPLCLSMALLLATGMAARALTTDALPKEAAIHDLNQKLADLLDELADGD